MLNSIKYLLFFTTYTSLYNVHFEGCGSTFFIVMNNKHTFTVFPYNILTRKRNPWFQTGCKLFRKRENVILFFQ